MGTTEIIAVYGSLKSDHYNHILIKGSTFLGKSTINATMYSLGSYPAIIDGEDEHEVELYEVSSEVARRVRGMEIGAGYVEVTSFFVTETGDEYSATIYYAGESLEDYCKSNAKVISKY